MKIFDADILVPEDQEIKAGGRIFTIGKIPMRICIKIYQSMAKQKDAENFDIVMNMADVVCDIFRLSDPTMTKDWVLDNVDIRSLAPMFTEIVEMMNRVAEKKPPQVVSPETAGPA